MSKKTSTPALDTLLRRRLRWAMWTVLACGLAAGGAAWWSPRQARAQAEQFAPSAARPAATVQTFNNTAPITFNDINNATPYPSTITVSGVNPATITKAQVRLNGLTHTFPGDVDVILVGPGGQRSMLMSDAGGDPDVAGLNLTFDQTAASPLALETQLMSGVFQPTNVALTPFVDTFPAPGPGALTDAPANLRVFNGADPNGVWSLYAVDDGGGDTGVISGGWTLLLTIPQVFTVNSIADPGNGACDASECALREAIAASQNGDLINFSPLFNAPQTIPLNGTELAINKNLTINGPGANLLTVSGNNASRVFNISGAFSVGLNSLTVTGGNNSGLNNSNGGNLTVNNCVITGNTGLFGGGIDNLSATLTVLNSTVSNNIANGSGAGGGINNFAGPLTVTNSTISGNAVNSGTGNGGGVRNGGNGTANVTNCTITNNLAAGGAGSAGGVLRNAGTVTLRNSIIAANVNNTSQPDVVANGGAGLTSTGFNLIGNRGAVSFGATGDQSGTGAASLNPQLASLANNGGPTATHALLPGSPALDAGQSSNSTTDQRGLPRPFDNPSIAPAAGGDNADIGAFEGQSAPVVGPFVVSITRASPNPASALSAVGFSVTFNTTVTGVDAGDFLVTTTGTVNQTNILSVNCFGSICAVVVFTGTGVGTLRLDLVDNDSIVDGSGTPLGGVGAGNGSFNSGEVYNIAPPGPPTLQFSAAVFTANESAARATITVTRNGLVTGASSVDYATTDNFTNAASCSAVQPGIANQRCDYATTRGTLTFASGEVSKTFTIPITDDFYPENIESVGLTLSNPVGGILPASPNASLNITDDDVNSPPPSERLFYATLNAAQEVPANNSTATGNGLVVINLAEDQLTVNTLSFSSLGSAQTAAHIHGPAPVGKNAPVLFTLPNGTVTNMTFAITPTQAAQLKAGLFYFNVHSQNFPNGEIRGQILPNPAENAQFFVRQQYADFLSRSPDVDDPIGLSFWTCQITGPSNVSPFCGTTPITDLAVIRQKRTDVSNAFFFENEYQQTGAFTYRLYRAAFGNTQPFPNTMGDLDSHPYCTANPNNCQLIRASHIPSYERFAGDRARLNPAQLAASQLALATNFASRAEFVSRYPVSQTAEQYVDALIANIQAADGANLTGQRANLIALFNGAGGGNAGRGAVLFRLAEDNQAGNPINNRPFIDAEYNRSFVTTQYYGYLRRDADLPGLNFWLSVVNQFPLRSPIGQNGMVCAFITSAEYQQRFNSYFTRTNQTDCP